MDKKKTTLHLLQVNGSREAVVIASPELHDIAELQDAILKICAELTEFDESENGTFILPPTLEEVVKNLESRWGCELFELPTVFVPHCFDLDDQKMDVFHLRFLEYLYSSRTDKIIDIREELTKRFGLFQDETTDDED